MPRANAYKKQFQEYDRNVGSSPLYFAGIIAAVILTAIVWSYSTQRSDFTPNGPAVTSPAQPSTPSPMR